MAVFSLLGICFGSVFAVKSGVATCRINSILQVSAPAKGLYLFDQFTRVRLVFTKKSNTTKRYALVVISQTLLFSFIVAVGYLTTRFASNQF